MRISSSFNNTFLFRKLVNTKICDIKKQLFSKQQELQAKSNKIDDDLPLVSRIVITVFRLF